MRDILFRGKRIDNGEWVEGSLIIDHYDYAGQHKDRYVIQNCLYGIDENGFCDFQSGISEEIDPLTLGQYTGLTDEYGKKIFEGDIIARQDSYDDDVAINGVIKYGRFNCSCCDGVYGWYIDDGDIRFLDDENHEFFVIGNVYDNPELLEERSD